jgi:cell division protein FtsL
MSETASAEQQIKDAVWQYTGWAVLLVLVFLSGVAGGYLLWGDAPALRSEVEALNGKVSGVRTEKENMQHQVNRLSRENEQLAAENRKLKSASPASATP